MTTQPTAKTTIVADAISNLYTQFQGAPVMNGIVASYAVQAQEIEDMFVDLLTERALPNAEGVQLDILGAIVGEPRQGRSDDDYRVAIGARVISNRSNATIEDILEVLIAAVDREYELTDHENAAFTVRVVDAIGTDSETELNTILQRVKGGGIRAFLVYSEQDDDNTFRFASGDIAEASTTTGFGADFLGTPTSGGYFADVVE